METNISNSACDTPSCTQRRCANNKNTWHTCCLFAVWLAMRCAETYQVQSIQCAATYIRLSSLKSLLLYLGSVRCLFLFRSLSPAHIFHIFRFVGFIILRCFFFVIHCCCLTMQVPNSIFSTAA